MIRTIRGVSDLAWQQLKVQAAQEERGMGDVLEDAVAEYVKRRSNARRFVGHLA